MQVVIRDCHFPITIQIQLCKVSRCRLAEIADVKVDVIAIHVSIGVEITYGGLIGECPIENNVALATSADRIGGAEPTHSNFIKGSCRHIECHLALKQSIRIVIAID